MKRKWPIYLLWLSGLYLVIGVLFWQLKPYFEGDKIIQPLLGAIGPVELHWYGLLIALGIISGLIWLQVTTKALELRQRITDLMLWAVLGGIIGARLLFMILKWPEFSNWQGMVNLTTGGLSIHGALIGGMISLSLFARRYHLSVAKIFDLFVPAVLIGQIIGRFGNFFNQEAFGPPTNLPWKMFVAENFRPPQFITDQFFHPTFLYEAIGLGVILLIILYWRSSLKLPGSLTLLYLGLYSVLRIVIEFFRVDSDYLGQLTIAQWGSLAAIITVAIISLILKYRSKY